MRARVAAALLTAALAATPADAMDARQFWPNFSAVTQGYYLDSPTIAWHFTPYGPGDAHFVMTDGSGCRGEHSVWLEGKLYFVFYEDCGGRQVWFAPPALLAIQDAPGPPILAEGHQIDLDGTISRYRLLTRTAGISDEGVIHFIADHGGDGTLREEFWFDPGVPLCDLPLRMPGLARYRKSNPSSGAVYEDAILCWKRP